MVPRRRRVRRIRDLRSIGARQYTGIEQADSFILDPHKWLFTPFDCCALIYRQPELATATHTQDASYLDVIHVTDGEWNPTDYAYHLTRRARGLPLWFSMAVYGLDAYREAIEAAIRLARDAAILIKSTPHLELIREPDLGVVLFRRIGWGPSDYESGRKRCTTRRSPSFLQPSGRARRSGALPSCTRTPRWSSSRRFSTERPNACLSSPDESAIASCPSTSGL